MNNLPWKTEGNKILNCKGQMLGGLGDKDNNELICRAVNNIEPLIESLKEFVEVAPCQNGCAKDDMSCVTRKAEKAIKAAEQ